ncbi:MAG: flagellar export chaperone FliS [Oscillospiraceae bacterium]
MVQSQVQNYREQAIKSMTSGELLVLLLDESIKNLRVATMAFDEGNTETFINCAQKSKDIFFYLSSILDMQYEISEDLLAIYEFIMQEIMKAIITKDKQPIDEIMPLVEDLRVTWTEANKIVNKGNS